MTFNLGLKQVQGLLLSILIPLSLRAVDFTWASGQISITYRFLPASGTLNDLQVITPQGFAFRPCRFGGITAFWLAGRLLYSWEQIHKSEYLGASFDSSGAYVAHFRWSLATDSLEFSLRLRLENKTLCIEAELDSPSEAVVSFSCDRSEATPNPKIIELPFGHPVLFSNGYFVAAILDPFYSRSSWLVPLHQTFLADSAAYGYGAWYFQRTDGHRAMLRERLYLTVSPWIEDTFYVPPLVTSSYRHDLANRVVVDLWADSFRGQEDFLLYLTSFGFKDLLVILHCWQKYGYDNGLPSTFPAGEIYGGEEGLKRIADLCQRQGFRFGLHTNYVDFYPNSDVWNPADVALSSRGMMAPSWYNPATGLQSYLLKPTRALYYAQLYEPKIHSVYKTSAAFFDVHTAILPSFKVDFDSRVEGAGEQVSTFLAYCDLLSAGRQVHQGPVAGEGYGYAANVWAGYVDSVEADPRSLYSLDKGKRASSVPAIVDYKLRVLHHRFVPYGLGLSERFFGPERPIPLEGFELYRAKEIAFGQAGYLHFAPGIERPPEDILREYCFLKHIQSRYHMASIHEIFYEIDGQFLSLSEALARILPACPDSDPEDFLALRLTKLKIVYDNNLTLFINLCPSEPWDILVGNSGFTLPPAGFLAFQGESFLAYTAMVDGKKEYFLWPAEPICRGTLQELILAPLDVRGEKKQNRSLFQVEYLNVLNWKHNPENKDIRGYRIYRQEKEGWELKGEVDAMTTTFWDRQVEKERNYLYSVVAFNNYGREGQAAWVEVR
ncbi:MAG: DUF5696 domain-containing protein [Candidatus Aminicenantales bacterium]